MKKHSYRDVPLSLAANGNSAVAVATHDQREFVLSGKQEPCFVGLMRGGYGNSIYVILEDERTLADEISAVIVAGLNARGFRSGAVPTSHQTNPATIAQDVARRGADVSVLLTLREWKFDIVGQVNLDYDVNLAVLNRSGMPLATKNLRGTQGLGSRFAFPLDYAEQVVRKAMGEIFSELFNSPEIVQALSGRALFPAMAMTGAPPPGVAPTAMAPVPVVGPSVPCRADTDCPGNQVCRAGWCALTGAYAAPQPLPQYAPMQPQAVAVVQPLPLAPPPPPTRCLVPPAGGPDTQSLEKTSRLLVEDGALGLKAKDFDFTFDRVQVKHQPDERDLAKLAKKSHLKWRPRISVDYSNPGNVELALEMAVALVDEAGNEFLCCNETATVAPRTQPDYKVLCMTKAMKLADWPRVTAARFLGAVKMAVPTLEKVVELNDAKNQAELKAKVGSVTLLRAVVSGAPAEAEVAQASASNPNASFAPHLTLLVSNTSDGKVKVGTRVLLEGADGTVYLTCESSAKVAAQKASEELTVCSDVALRVTDWARVTRAHVVVTAQD